MRDVERFPDFGVAAPGCHDFRDAAGPAFGFGLFAPAPCFQSFDMVLPFARDAYRVILSQGRSPSHLR